MSQLALIGMAFALPAVLFMLSAKVTGSNKWTIQLFIKLPALIYVVITVIMILKYYSVI